jgi:2-keto-3-deoxy-L-rhamnonate aldolase RhmA
MRNELKRRLRRGEQTFGSWITIESPIVTEMLSNVGLDYFVFDTEHSPLDIYQTQTLMQAMRGEATTPIVRVWWNDIVAIKRALDIGAHGVLVPWINDKKAAEQAVKATRYAPDGLRGCGPRRAELFDPDYLDTADDEIMVICQIETREAVDNIEEIASLEGVNVTYIGPSDLSASFGKRGNKSHPLVQEAIDRVFDATKAAGKAAGIHLGAGKTIRDRIDEGYDFITIMNDLKSLESAVHENMKKLGIR